MPRPPRRARRTTARPRGLTLRCSSACTTAPTPAIVAVKNWRNASRLEALDVVIAFAASRWRFDNQQPAVPAGNVMAAGLRPPAPRPASSAHEAVEGRAGDAGDRREVTWSPCSRPALDHLRDNLGLVAVAAAAAGEFLLVQHPRRSGAFPPARFIRETAGAPRPRRLRSRGSAASGRLRAREARPESTSATFGVSTAQ